MLVVPRVSLYVCKGDSHIDSISLLFAGYMSVPEVFRKADSVIFKLIRMAI